MNTLTPIKKKRYLELGLAVGVTAFLVLTILLVREYQRVQILEHATTHGRAWIEAVHNEHTLGASDVASIQSWMTFEYINHAFNLPPQYLQSKLSLNNAQFPRITIANYAKATGTAPATVLSQVQTAVSAYFATPQQ